MIAWFCDRCGVELQPGPRRPCPVTRNRMHSVSQRQLDLRTELAVLRLNALERAIRKAA